MKLLKNIIDNLDDFFDNDSLVDQEEYLEGSLDIKDYISKWIEKKLQFKRFIYYR